MKQTYISPETKAIELVTDDNIAQFVISSRSVGEGAGLAKEETFSFEYEDTDNADNTITSK